MNFESDLLRLCIDFNKKTFVVGYSGGPDSVFLLHMLLSLRKKHDFNIELAYARPFKVLESWMLKERSFVEDSSLRYSLPLHMKFEFCEIFGNVKNFVREYKYNFFQSIEADFILLGHNMNDNIENFLFRIARGTSVEKLFMSEIRGNILRPILHITKTEILEHLIKQRISFFDNPQNYDLSRSRHIIRYEIFPALKKININFKKNILKLYKDIDDFAKYTEKKSICDLLKKYNVKYNRSMIDTISSFKNGSKSLNLSYDLCLVYRYGNLSIVSKKTFCIKAISEIYFKTNFIFFDNFIIQYNAVKKIEFYDKNLFFFDADKVNFDNLYVRSRRDGDFFRPLGMNGRKKIKDFFIDEKISKFERDGIPIVFSSDKVLWIAGHRGSNEFSVSKETVNICRIELIKLG